MQAQISKIVAQHAALHRGRHHAPEPRDAGQGAGEHAERAAAEARQGSRRGRQAVLSRRSRRRPCDTGHGRAHLLPRPPSTRRSPRPAGSATSRRRSPATSRGAATTCASSSRCTARWTCAASTCTRSTSCRTSRVQRRTRTTSATACRPRACPAPTCGSTWSTAPPLFDRPRIYSDAPDEHVRYLMLTRAAFECCQRMGFAPEIVHAQRLAHGVRAAAAAHGLRVGPRLLRRHAQRVHHPQHRLPGRVLGRPGGRPRAGRRHRGAAPGRPRRRPHQPDAPRRAVRRRRHHREPDLRRRDPHARGRPRTRRRPARARRRGVRHPERRRLRRVESRHRPLHPAPLRRDDLSGKARNKAALLDLLRMPAPASDAAHRHGDATHAPEGHRPAVRHAARGARARATCASWRSAAASTTTSSSCTACRSASPGARCSTAATARNSRTSSRPRPTSS